MKNKKTKLMQIFVILIMIGMIGVPSATFTLSPLVTPVFAVSYDDDDLAQFVDAALENVTALISGSAAGMGSSVESGEVIHLSKVAVRASTIDYEVLSDPGSGILHNANPTFLRSYYALGRIMGTYNLKAMFSTAGMGSSVSEISSLMSIMAENDSAEATGFQVEVTDDFAIEDLSKEGDVLYMDYNNYTDVAEIEPEYSNLLEDLHEEDTGHNYLTTAEYEETQTHEALILGFDNTESDLLEVLRANIAANNSDATTTYTTSDISILDYDFATSNQTTYMTEDFVNTIRDKIDEILESEVAAMSMLNIFGFQIRLRNVVVPVKAFPQSIQFNLFGAISGALDNVVKTAKSFVSDPIRTTTSVIRKIGDTTRKVTEFVVKNHPVAIVANTVAKSASKTLGYLTAGLSRPRTQPIVKTVPRPVPKKVVETDETTQTKTFVQKMTMNNTEIMKATADEVADDATKATKITEQSVNEAIVREKPRLPNMLLVVGALALGLLALVAGIWVWRRRKSLIPI